MQITHRFGVKLIIVDKYIRTSSISLIESEISSEGLISKITASECKHVFNKVVIVEPVSLLMDI